MAVMVAAALTGCGSFHSWHWKVAGNCENLMPCSMAEDKVGF
jgi:hypothetical protein